MVLINEPCRIPQEDAISTRTATKQSWETCWISLRKRGKTTTHASIWYASAAHIFGAYTYWQPFHLFNLAYTDVCIALHTQCVCEKHFTGNSGGIRTHDLLLTSADVLTSRPPSLPDDDWPARIPYSSGFRDILFTQTLGKHWVCSAIHTSV